MSVDFDKDGGKIVSGGQEGTIKVWDSGAHSSAFALRTTRL
jgi:WD40 repeat protein